MQAVQEDVVSFFPVSSARFNVMVRSSDQGRERISFEQQLKASKFVWQPAGQHPKKSYVVFLLLLPSAPCFFFVVKGKERALKGVLSRNLQPSSQPFFFLEGRRSTFGDINDDHDG